MIRTFRTHYIRPCEELTGRLWKFTPCSGKHQGKQYMLATPGCFENHPDFAAYRGEGIYQTSFYAEGNVRLEFKGVSHTALVRLDGKPIMSHYNAYTIFDAIVTGLEAGEHILEVKVDNRFGENSALHIPNDYMSYGGISRPVVLEQIGEAYIRQVHVMPYKSGGRWHAKTEILIKNIAQESRSLSIHVKIADKEFLWEQMCFPVNEDVHLEWETEFTQVKEWMPGVPELYEVQVQLSDDGKAIDDYIDRFGFREVSIKDKQILLNGTPIQIKGVCRHEDHPQFGCALPFSAMAADLDIIRDLGANSVRTAHYPNDEVFLDLCDELGILVWEENHARGLSEEAMRHPAFETQAEQVIREMISAHYNHPSIYIWGILNECASETEFGRECYKKQFELIRNMDKSRPCSFASCKIKTDICLDLPDVVSYNIYPAWYLDTPPGEYLTDLYGWIQEETDGAGKPFLVTETGAGGLYGYRAAHKPKWSEEYQAEALEKQLNAILSFPGCSGVYIWQFCDIRVSDECFAGRPRTMNNKGLVDEYRRKKLAYDVVKGVFRHQD